MKIVGIIQARMGSTRLPGKTLIDIAGKPMLQHVIDRLSRAERIDEVVVATSTHPQDAPIVELADKLGVRAVAGSEDDVLDRFYVAAQAACADVVARVTADCPLVDPALSDQVIALYLEGTADYAANCIQATFPRGTETEVFSVQRLAEVHSLAQVPYEREHVTPFFYQHPERFRLVFVEAEGPYRRTDLRLCVDTEDDLRLIRAIYARLGGSANRFTILDVIQLLDSEPELKMLNSHVRQKKLGE